MLEIYRIIYQVANDEIKVLISGETGTGKELVAKSLHHNSGRRERPFVVVNCAGIPEGLLESELFGHVRGAFTDAYRDKPGKFQQANHGTLFLDEIGDMTLPLQVKILRALEDGDITRVGGEKPEKVYTRIIAATNTTTLYRLYSW